MKRPNSIVWSDGACTYTVFEIFLKQFLYQAICTQRTQKGPEWMNKNDDLSIETQLRARRKLDTSSEILFPRLEFANLNGSTGSVGEFVSFKQTL